VRRIPRQEETTGARTDERGLVRLVSRPVVVEAGSKTMPSGVAYGRTAGRECPRVSPG
jgi:hypothetical protein